MSENINSSIENREQDAAKAAAEENAAEIRKEYGISDDDYPIQPKQINSTSTKSDDKTKKEPPQMNIQLQH
ncbi:unnamed protein product [Rotaria sordida]|uniref:Uncharacterized protein n=1 Tax=Rotaria sordida TaxID=392033 RepID=A0A813VDI2_9BILA|nr:unnamed protein product [Rotaria sordida]CAF1039827.1 unnamed protein product [Rotaria sordida]CAF3851714.1 unnamed protein product [Rotaria sordida]CAF3914892.1 unnamed protein product [Rotaria sordida]